jgi:hypothetical protein
MGLYTDDDILNIQIIEDQKNIPKKNIFENYIATNKMVTSYPNFKRPNTMSSVDALDEWLDELDTRYDIFDKIEDLYLETDSLNDVPKMVLKFKNLKKVCICGSRFSNVTMDCLPDQVEEININGSNLDTFLYCGN